MLPIFKKLELVSRSRSPTPPLDDEPLSEVVFSSSIVPEVFLEDDPEEEEEEDPPDVDDDDEESSSFDSGRYVTPSFAEL